MNKTLGVYSRPTFKQVRVKEPRRPLLLHDDPAKVVGHFTSNRRAFISVFHGNTVVMTSFESIGRTRSGGEAHLRPTEYWDIDEIFLGENETYHIRRWMVRSVNGRNLIHATLTVTPRNRPTQ